MLLSGQDAKGKRSRRENFPGTNLGPLRTGPEAFGISKDQWSDEKPAPITLRGTQTGKTEQQNAEIQG